MKKSNTINNAKELLEHIQQLKVFCGIDIKKFCGLDIRNNRGDTSNVDAKRAYKTLKKITTESDSSLFSTINDDVIKSLINCCFFIIARSILDFKVNPFQKQKVLKTRLRFTKLLTLLIPDKFEEVVSIIMKILQGEDFFQGVVAEVFKCLWSCHFQPELVLEKILNLIEELIIRNENAKAKLIADGLPKSIDENLSDFPADGLTRLLSLYHLSVEITEPKNRLFHLKTAFEDTLIKFFDVMKVEELKQLLPKFLNLTFDTDFESKLALIKFAYTTKHAIKRISSNKIEDNLQPELFEFLLAAMSSDCKTKSSLACDYLSCLIDHHGNSNELSVPKIFYNKTHYKINMPKMENESAIKIIKDYSWSIQSSILTAVKLHSCNLCAFYKVICMIVVSIPSSHTFMMVIKTLLDMQTYALDGDLTQTEKNHIHACIISIMTLICWITKAKSMNKYIHEIVRMRFCHAPHLNPPLRKLYEYEEHHALFVYKEDLFLDKWEVRYCLWNRYRLNEETIVTFADGSGYRVCEDNDEKKNRLSRIFGKNHFRRKSEMQIFWDRKFMNLK